MYGRGRAGVERTGRGDSIGMTRQYEAVLPDDGESDMPSSGIIDLEMVVHPRPLYIIHNGCCCRPTLSCWVFLPVPDKR